MKIIRLINNLCKDGFLFYELLYGYILITLISYSFVVWADDYHFDTDLFKGSAYGQDLDRFSNSSNKLIFGEHLLDIYLNDNLVVNKENVFFKKITDKQSEPCLSPALIEKIQIRFNNIKESDDCILLQQISKDIYWDVNTNKLRLNLYIAQKNLVHNPRGYIPVSQWDEGRTALFLRHNTNYNHTENSGFNSDYLWSNLYSGINLGLWQLRHQGNFRYSKTDYRGGQAHYNSVRTWVQRPISQLDGTLILGETYTNSNLLGSLSFKGARFGSDQRMRPQSKIGYAPEVRGIASSSARVVIKQNNKIIYETSVPPGEFVINDLYNTAMQGDLNVEVIDSNGQTSYFTVPYTSTPDSVRVGNVNYEIALGKVTEFDDVDNKFIETTLQYGLSNSLTTNFAMRINQNYQAGLVGGVLSTSMGAFGLNTSWSRSDLDIEGIETGWRWEANYSNSFSSGTNIVLAAYRYSTEGYRDLQDVLGILRQQKNGTYYDSDTLKQRNRLSMTISQPLDIWGSLYVTGSTADYYGNKSRVNQLQMGYSNNFHFINYDLSIARQQVVFEKDDIYNARNKRTENTISLSISIPLDFSMGRPTLAFDANKTRDMKSGNIRLTGSAGKENDFSYSLYAGVDKMKNQGSSSNWGVNVQQNTSVGAFRGAVSSGKHYHQYNVGASGAIVVHDGGITLGPYISDTFALIHAAGAEGAIIKNGQGAKIDHFGYAIMPSLTPYRYNNIVLDTSEMQTDVELKGGGQRVVPYFGSMAEINFDTITGKAVLINLTLLDTNDHIPMGAEVFDENNQSIGMVGQGEQVYARLDKKSGVLNIIWGNSPTQKCRVEYILPSQSNDLFSMINLPCKQELQ